MVCHRWDFPLVLAEDTAPLVLEAELILGFFVILLSDCARGAASFITIFAWISSSLEALTFLGQKRVTKLGEKRINDCRTFRGLVAYVQRCRRHRSMSSPAACFSIRTSSIRRPMAAKDSFNIATLSSRGMSPPDNFNCFFNRGLRMIVILFLALKLTSSLFTGRNSSFVAASSIDGLG